MTKEEAIQIIIRDRLITIQDCAMFLECGIDANCWECGDNIAYSMALDALQAQDLKGDTDAKE